MLPYRRSLEILAANALDVESSQQEGISHQLLQRLLLSEAKARARACPRTRALDDTPKVADIVKMIRAIAQQEDPVGLCTSKLEVRLLQCITFVTVSSVPCELRCDDDDHHCRCCCGHGECASGGTRSRSAAAAGAHRRDYDNLREQVTATTAATTTTITTTITTIIVISETDPIVSLKLQLLLFALAMPSFSRWRRRWMWWLWWWWLRWWMWT
jgi:hypothetical protein